MVIPEITLYQIAKEKFGGKSAGEFVSAVKDTVDAKFKEKESIFLTKEDKTDIIKWMFIFWVGQLAAMLAIAKLIH
jgi:hypothetical protein